MKKIIVLLVLLSSLSFGAYDPNIPQATDTLAASQADILANFVAINALTTTGAADSVTKTDGAAKLTLTDLETTGDVTFNDAGAAKDFRVETDTKVNALLVDGSTNTVEIDTTLIVNEIGADVDTRIESDTQTHSLFIQGSDGFVGINKAIPTAQLDVVGAITATGALSGASAAITGGITGSSLDISSTSTGDLVVIESTNSLNQTAPDFILYRNSASPTVLDNLGLISFDGNNSSAARKAYALMFGSIVDPTAGSEKGQLNIFTLDSGTVTQQMTVKSNGVINFTNMPTSAAGLISGDLWSNSNIITIVP